MKIKWWTLLLLLPLCLTACGGTPEKEKTPEPGPVETVSGMVYVPKFTGAAFDANYVMEACVSGGKVYLVGDAGQYKEIEGPDGEMVTEFFSGTALFQGEPGGTAFRRIEGYRSFDLLDGKRGHVIAPACWPGEEDTVWLWTSISCWDDHVFPDYVQQFDAEGKELVRIELDALPGDLAEGDIDANSIYSVITDREERLYAGTLDRVFVYDRDQRLLCSLDAQGNCGGPLVRLADGRVAIQVFGHTAPDSRELLVIRPETGDWGESYALPIGDGMIYNGGGGWLFFCDNGDSLCGYSIGTGQLERILSWTGVGVKSYEVRCVAPLEDGRLLAVTKQFHSAETVVLTPTDPASLPEMTVLTYAALSLDSGTRSKIVEFNKAHPDCRIEVRDYSEYGTGPDPSAGRTRLQTELLAGNIPDLLDNAGLPMGQYARRGYLEDLLPWLEGDPDLGREAVMTQVIDAACRDGKLYQAFPSFTILTAAGQTSAVGDRVSWTWADLREAMEAMPEGSTVFGACGRVELLDLLLPVTVDALVDREAGTVQEEAVRSFLEFCAAAPLRTEWVEDIYTAALNGELLLLPAELTRLDSCAEVQMYTTAFGGPCSYVGYPREDGGAGSFFRLWDGISMASGCRNKEAAWSFLREAFLPKYPTGIYFGPSLPISRADFDRMAEISTGPMLDETGQPMETAGPACVMMPGSDLEIPIRPVTQKEYDHFMALFNAVDQVYDPDEALTAIIREEALAFLDGSRTLDDTVRLIENRGKLYLQETK